MGELGFKKVSAIFNLFISVAKFSKSLFLCSEVLFIFLVEYVLAILFIFLILIPVILLISAVVKPSFTSLTTWSISGWLV